MVDPAADPAGIPPAEPGHLGTAAPALGGGDLRSALVHGARLPRTGRGMAPGTEVVRRECVAGVAGDAEDVP
ncbi:hypothetical protein SLNHY_2361 [Streptomyces albus]|nr:hypothetical protein SLNHY_2361 [Streptomyces albus]